jgi:hypothetical protein
MSDIPTNHNIAGKNTANRSAASAKPAAGSIMNWLVVAGTETKKLNSSPKPILWSKHVKVARNSSKINRDFRCMS